MMCILSIIVIHYTPGLWIMSDTSLDYLDSGYSTNGNLTISSNLARVAPHQIFQTHIVKICLAYARL